jgi:RNA polymerase sigma factor (sigma-70 family)
MEGISRILRKMRSALYRRGSRREDIDDLTQDAFVRLLEYCRKGAEVREPEALLMTTVQRLAMNHARDRHADRYLESPIEHLMLEDPAPSPEAVLESEWCLKDMKKTLDALGPRTYQVFLLQRLYGYSYEQISELLGIPLRTIERHVARAMTALLKERNGEIEP